MIKWVRVLLLIEGLIFFLAALVHAGFLLKGYAHSKAQIAETVIGMVLWAGLLSTLAFPKVSRAVSLVVQAFALLGTLVGAVMIAIGVGPQTALDRLYHVFLILLLVVGLIKIWKSKTIR